jgi:hypothetical protein
MPTRRGVESISTVVPKNRSRRRFAPRPDPVSGVNLPTPLGVVRLAK